MRTMRDRATAPGPRNVEFRVVLDTPRLQSIQYLRRHSGNRSAPGGSRASHGEVKRPPFRPPTHIPVLWVLAEDTVRTSDSPPSVVRATADAV